MKLHVHKAHGRAVWFKLVEAPEPPPPGSWICNLVDGEFEWLRVVDVVLVTFDAPHFAVIVEPPDADEDPADVARAFEACGWERLPPALRLAPPTEGPRQPSSDGGAGAGVGAQE